MKAFANKRHNLTVVIGSVVYEFSGKSAEFNQAVAERASRDKLFADVLTMACKGTCSVGNRNELEAKDDPRMYFYNEPYALRA